MFSAVFVYDYDGVYNYDYNYGTLIGYLLTADIFNFPYCSKQTSGNSGNKIYPNKVILDFVFPVFFV